MGEIEDKFQEFIEINNRRYRDTGQDWITALPVSEGNPDLQDDSDLMRPLTLEDIPEYEIEALKKKLANAEAKLNERESQIFERIIRAAQHEQEAAERETVPLPDPELQDFDMPEELTCTKQEWKDFVDQLKLRKPDARGRRCWNRDLGEARSVVDFLRKDIAPSKNIGRLFLQLFYHDTITTENQAERALSRASTNKGYKNGYPEIESALGIFRKNQHI